MNMLKYVPTKIVPDDTDWNPFKTNFKQPVGPVMSL